MQCVCNVINHNIIKYSYSRARMKEYFNSVIEYNMNILVERHNYMSKAMK